MYYTVHNDSGGHARWRLSGGNHRTVAVSGEAFDSPANAKRAAEGFKAGCDGWTYDVYADKGGSYRWRAKSGNGAIVASSGEAFFSQSNARRAADNVRVNGGAATGP